jgi:hypothetical protein
MITFNFDEWADLYKNDPSEFERKRKEVLETEILKAPIKNRNKLRLLQIECDAIREVMHPLEATHMMLTKAQDMLRTIKGPLTQLRAECEDIAEDLKKSI